MNGRQCFDASVPRWHLWLMGAGPPIVVLVIVQGWANGVRGGDLSPLEVLLLLGTLQSLPVIALGWMLCSVAAYSVLPGRLVVHRVVSDRAYALAALDSAPQLQHGVITLQSGGHRLRVFANEPERCLDALLHAAGSGTPR